MLLQCYETNLGFGDNTKFIHILHLPFKVYGEKINRNSIFFSFSVRIKTSFLIA